MPYKTPGVYVEETSALPRSVAEVSTAVPAFIGYTKMGPRTAEGAKIARVSSLLEYEETFGGGKPTSFTATTTKTSSAETLIDIVGGPHDSVPEFLMYYGVKHYFQNGGGPCYIVSIGTYEDGETPDEGAFTAGLTLLEKEDEPTLILLTDAIRLITDPTATKRDAEKLETRKKRYAGYYAVCQTALAQCEKLRDRFVILDVPGGDWEVLRDTLSENLSFGAAYHPYLQTTLGFYYDESDAEDHTPIAKKLRETKSSNTALHAQIRTKLAGMRVVLPPSSAVAGIYAQVDRQRGVWKAPANVGISAVLGPVSKITDADQENLNVDPTGGKSINAIRAFTGKGTLVWGARTLAGNDNEWRYVSVRRLFLMLEESCKKATLFAVFEPNDQTTWLKVKGMIESYLFALWKRGALAGPQPDSAYFVKVGLGETMTSQDVLEGRMIVEIGVAAVRPAEFIIVRFSHKMHEA